MDLIACCLLVYHNKPFEIYCDLGEIVSSKVKKISSITTIKMRFIFSLCDLFFRWFLDLILPKVVNFKILWDYFQIKKLSSELKAQK